MQLEKLRVGNHVERAGEVIDEVVYGLSFPLRVKTPG